jgi:hypothetical protein
MIEPIIALRFPSTFAVRSSLKFLWLRTCHRDLLRLFLKERGRSRTADSKTPSSLLELLLLGAEAERPLWRGPTLKADRLLSAQKPIQFDA